MKSEAWIMPVRVRFKAVLFDLGGTLIKTAPIPEILRRILEAHGIQKSLSEIATAHRETESRLSLEDYAMPYDEFWIRWNLGILRGLKIQRNLRYLARVILEEWWDYADVELYPDVMGTLRYLRQYGFKTGIVTNGFKADIDEILSRVGLTGYFDVEVGVDAVGKPKPDREIFDFALKRLGVNHYEAVFVGDVLEIDYEGSAGAGLFAILLDRDDRVKEDVRKIRSLTELSEYLQ
ncbi:MAG: HAD family hydrolase [Candidatus Bathyarchaeia archaeon]